MFMADEVLYKMLAHPFLGRNYDRSLPDHVKQSELAVLIGDLKRIGRELKRNQQIHFANV